MAGAIGIDLGSHTVKVVTYVGRMGRFQPGEVHVARVEGEGLAARLDALRELLEELDVGDGAVATVGFPAERASIHLLTLPFSDRGRVEKVLPFELEGVVPFDPAEMVRDWRLLDPRLAPEEGSRALAVLADPEVLGELVEGLARLGLDPRHVALDGEAIGALAPGEGRRLVVDFGHRRTLVALVVDGEVVATRALGVGGAALTAAIERATGWDAERAEGWKHACVLVPAGAAAVAVEDDEPTRPGVADSGPGSGSVEEGEGAGQAERVRAAVETGLAGWFAELSATLFAFEEQIGIEGEEVLLCGGSASLEGLCGWLAERLGLPVRRPELPAGQDGDPAPWRYCTAWALARRSAGMAGGRWLELRQGRFAYKGYLAFLTRLLVGSVAAAMAIVLLGAAWAAWRSVDLRGRIHEAEVRLAATVRETFPAVAEDRARDPTLARTIVAGEVQAVRERVEALSAVLEDEPPMLSLLRDLSESMPPPDDVWIEVREMNLSPTSVKIKARTDGYSAASAIEQALQSTERFKRATRGDEKKVGERISFSLTIPLSEPEEEEAS